MGTTEAAHARSAAIDAVRVLGLTAVIVGHAFAEPVVRSAVYPWHVPVFFFLTGYLWTAGRSLGTELRKRSATLLRPYVAWLAITGTIVLCVRLATGNPVTPAILGDMLLGGTAIGSPLYTFWFATALLFAAVLNRMLERLPAWSRWAIALAALAVSYVFPHVVAGVPLSLGVAVPSVLFVLAGVVAKHLRPRIRRPLLAGCVLLVVCAALVATGVSLPVDIKQGDFGTVGLSPAVAAVASLGIVLVAEALVPRFGMRAARAIVALASGGLMVMLLHPIVLWGLGNDADAGSWPIFLAALVLPWLLALGIRRTRLAPWLLGVPGPPAPPDRNGGQRGRGGASAPRLSSR